MVRVLVVAYGNPLRCDDGLAWRVADELEGKFSSAEVKVLRVHQLAPEIAETVSRSEAVIFVDAFCGDAKGGRQPGEVSCEEICMPAGEARSSHQLSPSTIVALARQLYCTSPRAFSVTLAGQCFDHGELLSPVVAGALPVLAAQIEALAQQLLSSREFPP